MERCVCNTGVHDNSDRDLAAEGRVVAAHLAQFAAVEELDSYPPEKDCMAL